MCYYNYIFISKAILALGKNSISKILRYQIINSNLSLLIKKNKEKIFKEILQNPEEMAQFINNFTKHKVSVDELENYTENYITRDFKYKQADIVYKINGEEIYFLVEHQTKVDYSMPYRILNYCVEIIRRAVDEQKLNKATYKYPKVIPIVLYTGNAKVIKRLLSV